MRIIFAGGGTGGHLFPGIALAQELFLSKEIGEKKLLFLCTNKPFDQQQLSRYKLDYQALPSPRLPALKNPLSILKFLINLIISLYYTHKYFRRFKPEVVIGLGGYGSFSPLTIAILRGIPFALLEQNVLPGKITRFFSPFARYVFCQWDKSAKYLRNRKIIRSTGSPIRKEILLSATDSSYDNKANARKQLDLTKEYILLVIGGSQGAEAINKTMIDNIDALKKVSDRLGIIHLTGEREHQRVKDTYKKTGIEAVVKPFSEEMNIIYSASDFALSRAGGIAIAEMAMFGLPMILVPYPNAADNHQFFNALEVQQSGAGVIINQDNLSQKIEIVVKEFLRMQSSSGYAVPEADPPLAETKTLKLKEPSQHAKSLARDKAARIILNYLRC